MNIYVCMYIFMLGQIDTEISGQCSKTQGAKEESGTHYRRAEAAFPQGASFEGKTL